jgi:hypothetical protein
MTQRRDESDGFPVPMRHFLDEPLALRCSPVEAGDRRRDAGFINEDQSLQIKPWLLGPAFVRFWGKAAIAEYPLMSRFGFTSEVRTIVVGSEFVRYHLSQGMPIKLPHGRE